MGDEMQSRTPDIGTIRRLFDKKFPASSNFQVCLETVHHSYNLFEVHKGHKENDKYLEEAYYATQPIVLDCVKQILATGLHNVQPG